MASSPIFEALAETLEQITSLDRLEARGTLRLALREAGLKPDSLTKEQTRAVLHHILPAQLEERGIGDPEQVCGTLAGVAATAASAAHSAEDLFRRVDSDRGLTPTPSR
jgi:hypothetical protein